MNSEITLSLRPEILEKVEQAARQQSISPADYLVRFLEKVLNEPLPEESVTELIERLAQSVTKISESEHDQETQDFLNKKYGETPLEAIQRLSKGVQHLTDAEYAQRKHDHLTQKYGGR